MVARSKTLAVIARGSAIFLDPPDPIAQARLIGQKNLVDVDVSPGTRRSIDDADVRLFALQGGDVPGFPSAFVPSFLPLPNGLAGHRRATRFQSRLGAPATDQKGDIPAIDLKGRRCDRPRLGIVVPE